MTKILRFLQCAAMCVVLSACVVERPDGTVIGFENSLTRAQANRILIDTDNESRTAYAVRQLTRLAQGGDAQAQVQLGFRYLEGDKVVRDRVRAADLFERSLRIRDNPGVRLTLANLYTNIADEPVDVARGVALYEELVAQGDARARQPLANQYYLPYLNEGDGSRIPQAAALYAELAREGDANSQFRLATLYTDENAPIHDFAQGLALYEDLAAKGDNRAQYVLGELYWQGDDVPRDDARAIGYFQQAAAQGNPNAKVYVALGLLGGRGVARDTAAGFAMLADGMREGGVFASYILSIRDEALYLDVLGRKLSAQGLEIAPGRAGVLAAQTAWCTQQQLEADCAAAPLEQATVLAVARSFPR